MTKEEAEALDINKLTPEQSRALAQYMDENCTIFERMKLLGMPFPKDLEPTPAPTFQEAKALYKKEMARRKKSAFSYR